MSRAPRPLPSPPDPDSGPRITVEPGASDVALVHDGSLEGLLSAVFAAYELRIIPGDIAGESAFQPRLGQRVVPVDTDAARAERVARGIANAAGPAAFDALRTASLSDDADAGTIVYRFVRFVMDGRASHAYRRCPKRSCGGVGCAATNRCVLSNIAEPAVADIVRLQRAVANERHRMEQFLRFSHVEGGVWFARCSPAASVVPLLMGHFRARFGQEPFVIYDEAHRLAGLCDGRSWRLVPTEGIQAPAETEDERLMQDAWRRFYRSVSIEARYHPELQRQFMPRRLWANLTELFEELPTRGSAAAAQTPVPSKAGMKLSSAAGPCCQK